MINSWQTITSGSSVREAWNPPSLRPISICFEFRSKTSLITIICMDPHSPNNLIVKKYCFLILLEEQIPVSFSWSDFLIFLFSVISYYFVIINFYQNYVIIILFNFFFHENYYYFFMFRNVPCSGVLSTPTLYSPRPSFPTFSLMFIAPLNFKFPT